MIWMLFWSFLVNFGFHPPHTKAISPSIVLYFTTFHSHRPLFSTCRICPVPWNNSHWRVRQILQVAIHTRTFNKQYNDLRRHVQNWISQSLRQGIEGTKTKQHWMVTRTRASPTLRNAYRQGKESRCVDWCTYSPGQLMVLERAVRSVLQHI